MERIHENYHINNYYQRSAGTKLEPIIREVIDKYTKPEIEEKMKQMGLPIFKSITSNRQDFLDDPVKIFNQLPSELYLIEIKSSITGEKKRISCGDTQKIISIINNNNSFDRITLKENYDNLYSGNVVVSTNKNTVYVEMVKGRLTELLHQGRVDYIAARDVFFNTFKYNTDDPHTRKLILNVLAYIPSPELTYKPNDYEREFLPGYFEFFVVDKNDGHGLQPIFHNYSQVPAYTNTFRIHAN